MGGLIGANFIERNDITDANTEFTGYCRLYSGTNAPDRKQGILISIFTGSCTAQFYFFSWPKAFYVRLKWDTWGEWTYVASIKDDLFCHFRCNYYRLYFNPRSPCSINLSSPISS